MLTNVQKIFYSAMVKTIHTGLWCVD